PVLGAAPPPHGQALPARAGRARCRRSVRAVRRPGSHAWAGEGPRPDARRGTGHDRRGIVGWRTDGLGPFVVETAAPTDRRVVGQAGLMVFDTRGWTPSSFAGAGRHAQPELGWALIRAHWGHGYATEAAAAIRDWASEWRSIVRLVSLISPGNVRSERVAERLGAVPGETVTPADTGRPAVVWSHRPCG